MEVVKSFLLTKRGFKSRDQGFRSCWGLQIRPTLAKQIECLYPDNVTDSQGLFYSCDYGVGKRGFEQKIHRSQGQQEQS